MDGDDGLKIVTGFPPLFAALPLLLLPPVTGETKARAETLMICLVTMLENIMTARTERGQLDTIALACLHHHLYLPIFILYSYLFVASLYACIWFGS